MLKLSLPCFVPLRLLSFRFSALRLACLGVLLVYLAVGTCFSEAFATPLPTSVVQYLQKKDSEVRVRFDGLISFSNGELYLPVFPQKLAASSENAAAAQVLSSLPEKAQYPDLVELDNRVFLLRLIPTDGGFYTLLRQGEYPLSLKEGLFPQDLVLPSNLSIPSELKVLLGSIAYSSPVAANNGSMPAATARPVGQASEGFVNTPNGLVLAPPSVLYVADLNQPRILGFNPEQPQTPTWSLGLDCLPIAVEPAQQGKKLYVPCLGRDEVLVLDTRANLIQTRIPLEGKPHQLWSFPKQELMVLTTQFGKQLHLVSTRENELQHEYPLPGNVSVITGRTDTPVVYAYQSGGPAIYEIDVQNQRLLRTLNDKGKQAYLSNVSSMLFQPVVNELGRLWLLSRSTHQVQVIDLATQKILASLKIAQKPVEMAFGPNQTLLILCAEGERLEVLNTATLQLESPIALPAGSFPSAMSVLPSRSTALVAGSGGETLTQVNLLTGSVSQSLPFPYRAADMIYVDPGASLAGAANNSPLPGLLNTALLPQGDIDEAKGPIPVSSQSATVMAEKTETPPVTKTPSLRPSLPQRLKGVWPFGGRAQR
jgi:DNA-binding beta-propeller fold protein YncE